MHLLEFILFMFDVGKGSFGVTYVGGIVYFICDPVEELRR